ncbi:hypothetical protein OQA88_6872 [Cercophora sp. LCS_1]
MRWGAVLPLAFGLAVASPTRINVGECIARDSNGPMVTNPNTPEHFQNYPDFNAAALSHRTNETAPKGFYPVPNFINLRAAAQEGSYLGSIEPPSYSPEYCAAVCVDMDDCWSFNIFYERVPLIVSPVTLSPDPVMCPATEGSPSATFIKCSFFSDYISGADATNGGQYQGDFLVVFTGSNGYIRWEAPSVLGFVGPVDFAGATISAPYGYLRMESFDDYPFAPEVCADTCDGLYDYDPETGRISNQCIFFNAYLTYKNNGRGVFNCAYYSEYWGPDYATNKGQTDNRGNVINMGLSHGYYLDSKYFLPENIDDYDFKANTRA